MRWLLDEGIPKAVSEWLSQKGDDVFDVAASDKRGCEDLVLWKMAGDEHRIVVTRDLRFLMPNVSPGPLGVVIIRIPDTYLAKQSSNCFKKLSVKFRKIRC
ncbi:DUF5615 family PIN-like protein [bacterium]|nr:DUF5615 family PIN-like protein [bacterium]